MKFIRVLMLVCVVSTAISVQPSLAGSQNYLLINLTSYTGLESQKAIDHAKAELKRGRPVVIFLPERGVLAASKTRAPV